MVCCNSPRVHVPTAEIFKKFAGRVLTEEGRISIMRILETTQQRRNELQQVVSGLYPAVNEVLSELKKYGSPLMTGSGACVFLECQSKEEADKVYQAMSVNIRDLLQKGLNSHPLLDIV
jgi:4-diphosphocytidyl-2-C-methyl-D-erythritol kinase